MEEEIGFVCDKLKVFLIEKNRKYGNSALNPVRIFSGQPAIEGILVRIDDKLSRIINREINTAPDKDSFGSCWIFNSLLH
ncbi:hypothetical protein FACS1894164_10990 [Spirochaetia bacterium]|nr:hypothetical protein FACS1894164_10990 [Spirochaetia bacterium]